MFIKDNLSWINVSVACKCLRVTRSCYYNWINNAGKRLERANKRQILVDQIKDEYTKSKKRYGSTKITKSLKSKGICVNHKTVEKLMRANNIKSVVNKKYKATTNSNHTLDVFDNILDRQFNVAKPNVAWVGDITYCATDEGWLYLATVLDLYSNKVIGYAMSKRINKELVINALRNALKARNYPINVIVHSDRGSQYASKAYKALLKEHGLIGSMSRKGNCWGATRSRLTKLSYPSNGIRPPMLLGEPTVMNKELTGQCNEALCAGFCA
ncbi:MAG TPA: IS3 family transposase [Aquella sp.]|nr:IS3 family transposase [Aquella sp.]